MTEAAVSLETVCDAIPVGLAVVGPDRRIALMNPAFLNSLNLPPGAIRPGMLVEDAVRGSALRGVYGPGDPEEQVQAVLAPDRSQPGFLRRRHFNGRVFDLYNTPLAGGWYAVTAIETTVVVTDRAEAEAALAQTTTALSTLRVGLGILDGERRLRFHNPRFAALLSVPPDRLFNGLAFDSLLDLMRRREEYAAPEGAAFIASLRTLPLGRPWAVRRRRGDGRSIELSFDPLPDGGCTLLVSDITPQVQAEDDARRRAALLDMVLLNVPHGICVYGPDNRVAMFNATYAQVMDGAPLSVGDSRADVARRRSAAGEYGDGDPDQLFATQMAHDMTIPQMRRRTRPNGTVIDVRTAPLPDGGYISVVTDVTALVQAETALRQRAAEMSTMLGNIHHGILFWSAEKRLLASNHVTAELLGLPPEMLSPGTPEQEVLARLHQHGWFDSRIAPSGRMELLLTADRSVPFAREVTTTTGRSLSVRSNPAPGGGWVTTYTDITPMRQAEVELRKAKDMAEAANQAKSRFLATVSHELRTPLNAIIGFSDELLRDHGQTPADLVAEFAGHINSAGQQLLSVIDMILTVARIDGGRFGVNRDPVDPAAAIAAAVRQIENAARAGDVALRCEIQPSLPRVIADEPQLVQALTQILSNSVKFTSAGGHVVVRAERTDQHDLRISVADTGIGIPAADLERVFEPFMQVQNSLSRRYPGAGLGLFLARAIIVAHAGELTLQSVDGHGTTAQIILPRSHQDASDARAETRSPQVQAPAI